MNVWGLGVDRVLDNWLLVVDWLLLNWLGNNCNDLLLLPALFVILLAGKSLESFLRRQEFLNMPEVSTHDESQDKLHDLAHPALLVMLSMLSVHSMLAMLSMESTWTLFLTIFLTSVELLGNAGLHWGTGNNNWSRIILEFMVSFDSWSSVVLLSTMTTSVVSSSSELLLILIILWWSSSVVAFSSSHSIHESLEESWLLLFFFLILEVFLILHEEIILT